LDIGLYDDGLASSSPDFFNLGVTNESLKHTGMQPVDNERLNICVKNGVRRSATFLSTATGMGSTADDLSGIVGQWRLQRHLTTVTETRQTKCQAVQNETLAAVWLSGNALV